MKKFLSSYFFIFLLAAAIFFVSQESEVFKPRLVKYSETKIAMGTVVRFDICADMLQQKNVSSVFNIAWRSIKNTENVMSAFDATSEVSQMNASKGKVVNIDRRLYQLLAKSLYFSYVTNGAFDVTVWPLMQLWKTAREKNVLPRDNDIKRILKFSGGGQIKLLDNLRVQLAHPLTQIDLSGIAKGYAVDQVADIFRQAGFSNFLIDAGGDIYAGGMNCEKKPWRVGVRDPEDRLKVIDTIVLTDKAVTTSGSYEQFFEIKGKKYTHILDPRTGYPSEKAISATVIASKAQDADALSTALCVLGPQEGTAVINDLGADVASLIITKDAPEGKILKTISREYKKYQAPE